MRSLTARSVLNLALLLVIAPSLLEARWQSLYGLLTLGAALGLQLLQRRRTSAVHGQGGDEPA